MATLYKEVSLAVAPDALWEKVSKVGEVDKLLNVIAKSELDGDVRVCTMADGGVLRERIVGIDDAKRRVAYTISDAPFPLEFHAASMQVIDEGDGRLTFRWVTDLKPDALAAQLEPLFDGELSGLAERYGS